MSSNPASIRLAPRLAALRRLARRQDGLWTMDQARKHGFARSTIRRWVRSGVATAWNDRVLSDGALPSTWERRARAAHLAIPGSVVVGPTAGRLHDLALPARAHDIEVAAPRSTRHRPHGVLVRRPRRLPQHTTVRGIVVATAAEAIVGLAGVVDPLSLDDLVADALRRRRTTPDGLRHALLVHPTAPGRARLVVALDRLVPTSVTPGATPSGGIGRRSPLETAFAALLQRQDLPTPQWGAVLPAAGRRYELDAWWPDHGLAVELDGHRFHATPGELQRDAHRQNDLLLGGVRLLLRFTHADVHGRPEHVLDRVSAGLTSAAP